MDISVRPAQPEDAAAIAEIYNQGIRGGNATFETEERTPEERRRWLSSLGPNHPCLVAVTRSGGCERIAGWIAASDYRPRDCYRGIAEFSVYVHDDFQRHGVGRILMDAFIPACRDAGLWKILSRVFPENTGSRALCKASGFREVGRYEKHAWHIDRWRDVIIVERLIEENLQGPPPA